MKQGMFEHLSFFAIFLAVVTVIIGATYYYIDMSGMLDKEKCELKGTFRCHEQASILHKDEVVFEITNAEETRVNITGISARVSGTKACNGDHNLLVDSGDPAINAVELIPGQVTSVRFSCDDLEEGDKPDIQFSIEYLQEGKTFPKKQDGVVIFKQLDTVPCANDADCGEGSQQYYCQGHDLMRKNIIPICDEVCSIREHIETVLSCELGCSEDACIPPTCMAGDFNMNGNVDLGDLAILGTYYGQRCNLSNRCCNYADINNDGEVDLGDLAILGSNYGRSTGPCNPRKGICK